MCIVIFYENDTSNYTLSSTNLCIFKYLSSSLSVLNFTSNQSSVLSQTNDNEDRQILLAYSNSLPSVY